MRAPLVLVFAVPALLVGCFGGSDAPTPCVGEDCGSATLKQEVVDHSHICDFVFVDGSANDHTTFVRRLGDPLTDKVYRGIKTANSDLAALLKKEVQELTEADLEGLQAEAQVLCPTSFTEISARLRETDSAGCGGAFGGPSEVARKGIFSALVTEGAQVLGQLSTSVGYRTVTSRNCGGRPQHGLLFSLFGLGFQNSAEGLVSRGLNESVEIIAFSEQDGVFNYYQAFPKNTFPGQPSFEGIVFFGNSQDMLEASNTPELGPEGENPPLVPRRCAKCHQNGGLIMKELPAPWLHWEGDFRPPEGGETPGVPELLAAHEDLGNKSNGIAVEGLVRSGNREWNKARLRRLRQSGSLKDLLRPVFCSNEVNISNGSSSFSPPDGLAGREPDFSDARRLPVTALIDSAMLRIFSNLEFRPEDYDALIVKHGQRVANLNTPKRDANRQPLGSNEMVPAIDTVFDLLVIDRAGIDADFVTKLVQSGIVDQQFVRDVAMVDFTRPVFSDERCALLEFAPEIDNDALVTATGTLAAQIREGFIDNLVAADFAAGSAPDVFLTNLKDENDALSHRIQAGRYLDACAGQIVRDDQGQITDSSEFLENVYQWVTAARRRAARLAQFEFSATMPRNNLVLDEDSLRLDPNTCEPVNTLVLPATVEIPETFDACILPPGPEDEDEEDPPDEEDGDADKGPVVCQTGPALAADCHPCVTEVCRQNRNCCDQESEFGNWGQFCVRRAVDICGVECPNQDGPGGPIFPPPFPPPIFINPVEPLVEPFALEPVASDIVNEVAERGLRAAALERAATDRGEPVEETLEPTDAERRAIDRRVGAEELDRGVR